MILDNSKRPEIKYPCEWEYKVIGKNVDKLIKAIEKASQNLDYEITPSNISRNENYFSLNLKITVQSETVRNLVYQKLNDDANVIIVL